MTSLSRRGRCGYPHALTGSTPSTPHTEWCSHPRVPTGADRRRSVGARVERPRPNANSRDLGGTTRSGIAPNATYSRDRTTASQSTLCGSPRSRPRGPPQPPTGAGEPRRFIESRAPSNAGERANVVNRGCTLSRERRGSVWSWHLRSEVRRRQDAVRVGQQFGDLVPVGVVVKKQPDDVAKPVFVAARAREEERVDGHDRSPLADFAASTSRRRPWRVQNVAPERRRPARY
jgi:hypothetical protein